MISISGMIAKITPTIHRVVPVTPPTSLPKSSNLLKPERNFNTESIVNINAIISKIAITISDPIDADNKEPKDADTDVGLLKILGSDVKITASDVKMSMAPIADKIAVIIAYNDPFRKSCSA
jgi:hypothetical protein